MKRRIFKLALFLLLGAILNVAVAWGCALVERMPWGVSAGWADDVPIPQWMQDCVAAEDETLEENDSAYRCRSLGTSVIYVSVQDETLKKQFEQWRQQRVIVDGIFGRNATFVSVGVPFRTMRGEYWAHSGDWQARHPGVLSQKLVGMLPLFATARPLPYFLIWSGLAINTIFYAAILWLPFAAFGRIRRRRRIKRGLCPACAYPVGTNSVCTECGKQVKP